MSKKSDISDNPESLSKRIDALEQIIYLLNPRIFFCGQQLADMKQTLQDINNKCNFDTYRLFDTHVTEQRKEMREQLKQYIKEILKD